MEGEKESKYSGKRDGGLEKKILNGNWILKTKEGCPE